MPTWHHSVTGASAAVGLTGTVVFGVEVTGLSLPVCPLAITILELFSIR